MQSTARATGSQPNVVLPLPCGALQGPPDWHPAPQQLKDAARRAGEAAGARGVSLARLAIKEAVKNEDIATTLVGLCTPEQVCEGMGVF